MAPRLVGGGRRRRGGAGARCRRGRRLAGGRGRCPADLVARGAGRGGVRGGRGGGGIRGGRVERGLGVALGRGVGHGGVVRAGRAARLGHRLVVRLAGATGGVLLRVDGDRRRREDVVVSAAGPVTACGRGDGPAACGRAGQGDPGRGRAPEPGVAQGLAGVDGRGRGGAGGAPVGGRVVVGDLLHLGGAADSQRGGAHHR